MYDKVHVLISLINVFVYCEPHKLKKKQYLVVVNDSLKQHYFNYWDDKC